MGEGDLCYLLGNQIKAQLQKGSTEHLSQLNSYQFYCLIHVSAFPKAT